MIARERIRELGLKLTTAADGRDDNALVDITAKDARDIAEILTTSAWFTINELKIAAGAMAILEMTRADAWTMRARLDEFWAECEYAKREDADFSAGVFAAFLYQKGGAK